MVHVYPARAKVCDRGYFHRLQPHRLPTDSAFGFPLLFIKSPNICKSFITFQKRERLEYKVKLSDFLIVLDICCRVKNGVKLHLQPMREICLWPHLQKYGHKHACEIKKPTSFRAEISWCIHTHEARLPSHI